LNHRGLKDRIIRAALQSTQQAIHYFEVNEMKRKIRKKSRHEEKDRHPWPSMTQSR
jgi:predicted nuclease with TOPRIM domain